MSLIKLLHERDAYVLEQKIYDECKTKADYIHYLDLYPNGQFASRAHNKIEHFEKIVNIKKDVQKEKKEKQEEKREREEWLEKKPEKDSEEDTRDGCLFIQLVSSGFVAFLMVINCFNWYNNGETFQWIAIFVGALITFFGVFGDKEWDWISLVGSVMIIIGGYYVGNVWLGLFFAILAVCRLIIHRR